MSSVESYPEWLPDEVPYTGNWDAFVRTLYAIFEADFKYGRPKYLNCPIWYDKRIEADDSYGFEEAFWHLITKDKWVWNPMIRKKEKQRLPEFDRASKMPWTKPVIDHDTDNTVLSWNFEDETKRGTAIRTYIWLKEFEFVVILQRQQKRFGDIFMLITSFYVDAASKQKDLERRYERRIK